MVYGRKSVAVTGTLTGEGVGYKNNAVAVACDKAHRECLTSSIEQIGRNQLSTLQIPWTIPVSKWNSVEIIALANADAVRCRKLTINIVRKNGTVLWVEEPINQTSATCKDVDTKLYKWTIEDPPFWKSMRSRAQSAR